MEEAVHGTTMPVLELSLQAGESIVSEAGEFSWMSDAIQMETNTGGGIGGKGILGVVKRAVSGASVMMTTYMAQGGAGSGRRRAAVRRCGRRRFGSGRQGVEARHPCDRRHCR